LTNTVLANTYASVFFPGSHIANKLLPVFRRELMLKSKLSGVLSAKF